MSRSAEPIMQIAIPCGVQVKDNNQCFDCVQSIDPDFIYKSRNINLVLQQNVETLPDVLLKKTDLWAESWW